MEILKNTDETLWWSVAKKCEYATFFHTPLWHKLAAKSYPNYCDQTIIIRFGNGKEVVLPLLNTNVGSRLFRRLHSTFAGCYGGLICGEHIEPEEREQVYHYLATDRLTQFHITGNPIGSAKPLHLPPNQTSDFTHILTLETRFDQIFANFSKGHRSSYKKGCKMGVTVREADKIEDYQDYFHSYKDSLKRWGDNASSSYPWQLFESGYYISQKHPHNLKLWLAEVGNKIIAGAWVFYWNQHVVWWHGAAYEAFFSYYPNNVLQTEIIKDAHERGFRYYDFNPSGGHESVARFKGRFGAEKRPFTRIVIDSPLLRVGKKIKQWVR